MSALLKKDDKMSMTTGRTLRSAAFRRGMVAVFAAAVAATGPLPQAAHADTSPPGEVTIPSAQKVAPVGPTVAGAGADGYLLQDEQNFSGVRKPHYVWHPADGSGVHDFGADDMRISADGRGTTVLWTTVSDTHDPRVYDTAKATWTTYGLPSSAAGAALLNIVPTSSGWSLAALVPVKDASGNVSGGALHLYEPGPDGSLIDRPVQGWQSAGTSLTGTTTAVPGRLFLRIPGNRSPSVLIDTDTATVTYTGSDTGRLLLSTHAFGWSYPNGTAVLRSIDDPQATPRTLGVPPGVTGTFSMALTDSALVVAGISSPLSGVTGSSLYSIPLDGTTPAVLLTAAGGVRPATDGGALVDVRSASESWATYKIPADGGAPTVLEPFTSYHPENIGLSLTRGEIRRVQFHALRQGVVAGDDIADTGAAAAPDPATTVTIGGLVLSDSYVPRCGQDRCLELVDGGGSAGPAYTWSYSDTSETDLSSLGARWNVPVGPAG
ncbi:MAG TPA: hypothetical protein VGL02_02910, partial [Streptomyces sp.]